MRLTRLTVTGISARRLKQALEAFEKRGPRKRRKNGPRRARRNLATKPGERRAARRNPSKKAGGKSLMCHRCGRRSIRYNGGPANRMRAMSAHYRKAHGGTRR